MSVRQVQRKREPAWQSGKKGKFIRGKREGDWLLRRTSILPFWQSPSYTPPMKNSLKGWSRSQRSGIWWWCSFEKISTSDIRGCHLGSLVSLTNHCHFIFHLQGRHNKPSYQWDPTWTLSISTLYDCFWHLLKLEHHCFGCSETSLWQDFPVVGRVIRPPFLDYCQTGDSGMSCLSIFNINTWVCQS